MVDSTVSKKNAPGDGGTSPGIATEAWPAFDCAESITLFGAPPTARHDTAQ